MNHPESPKENERTHIFDNLGNIRRLILGFFVCCALLDPDRLHRTSALDFCRKFVPR